MNTYFKQAREKLFGLKDLDRNTLLYQVFPHFLFEIMRKYFRLQTEGFENLPQSGRGLIIANHSGYSGFDAFILSQEIYKYTQRIPKILTHPLWFITETTTIPMNKLGFIEANTPNAIKYLENDELVGIFPEGEYGNFKPTAKAYHLQDFRRGFIRIALKTRSPIIPCVIIGAEETHINLRSLKFNKYISGSILPLPLNVIPLPAKWKIRIFEPYYLPYKPESVHDTELVHELAEDFQEKLQKAIQFELKRREFVYF